MSWTTSPGRSRGSENTITDAISSDGIATSRRRRTYFFTPRGAPRLLVQPGGHPPARVIVADVGAEVLHIGLPRRHRAHRGAEQDIGLLGHVALDVVDDVPSLGHVEGAALQLEHVGELGSVDARGGHR